MSSYVFELSDCKSILQKNLSHPINNDNLKVALIGFYTTYLTPNITNKNNKLSGTDFKEIIIPPGQYDIDTLEKYINTQPPFNSKNISIHGNDVANRIDIKSPYKLIFNKGSIGEILGFENAITIEPNQEYTGTKIPKFHPFEKINIHCHLARGMILKQDDYNHRKSDRIASFRTNAEYKCPIIYEPTRPLFFPLKHLDFDRIDVSVLDENENVIDFGGSLVTVILQVCETVV